MHSVDRAAYPHYVITGFIEREYILLGSPPVRKKNIKYYYIL